MSQATLHRPDAQRLAALHRTALLDSPPEEGFDRLTRLAARLLGAPIALIGFVAEDRQFLKSATGLPEGWAARRELPLTHSYCRYVVESGQPLVVEDARRHPLVRYNPAIRELSWIAYAGVPLTTADGHTLGALSVIDALPRLWSVRDMALLRDLGACVVTEIELRSARMAGSAEAPVRRPLPQQPAPGPVLPEAGGLPTALIGTDGRWLRVSRALADLLGTTPDALVGRPGEAFTHPDDRAADREATRLLLAGECASYTVEKRMFREGEAPIWVLTTVSRLSGPPDGFLVAFHDITHRKLAELDLQIREERHRLAAEATQDVIYDWDLLTDRIVWGEQSAFGYRPHSASTPASWWYERIHSEDRERIVTGIQTAIAGGDRSWSGEYRFRRADDGYAHVLDRGTIVRDPGGDAVRMVGTMVDTSERHRAELLARRQAVLLEQIASGLDLDVVLAGAGRLIEEHGQGLVAAILLLDPESRTLRLAHAPGLGPAARAALEAAVEPGGAGASVRAASSGSRAVIADLATDREAEPWRAPLLAQGLRAEWAVPLLAADGALLGTLDVFCPEARTPVEAELRLLAVAGDLAEIAVERSRSQEALARGVRLLEQVLETLPIGVWVLDRQGRILFGNSNGWQIWGGARSLGIDDFGQFRAWRTDTGELLTPEGWAATRAIRYGETVINEVLQIEAFDGAPRTILNSAVPLRGLDGEIVGAITLTQDVSEQRASEEALRRSEEHLRHAQKMEAVGQLAGGIAHDFNNLLTGILSYSDLVLQELRAGDPMREDIDQIRQAAQRAAALTRQLLAFSRRQVLQPKVLSLNAVVSSLDSMLHRLVGADVSLETDLDPDLWPVLADPGQLEQVLVNLVVNARDAMPGGGRIVIATANLDVGELHAARSGGVPTGAYASLSVADTGAGMDVQTQARVFDPFFTTKEAGKGTGLGLSTVYGIVEQSGGHIALESAPGQGATFTIYLPRYTGPLRIAPEHHERRTLPGGTETVLLVEDEATVRSSVHRLLRRHGYKVIEARHGADALRIAEDAGETIDMVLTDIVMPEMGGRELVDRLRDRHPGLKVLFMSGYSDKAVAVDGVMPPDTGFVQKPFTAEELTRRIREILDG
jgi:two-component system cell cycle sensor histidine kinase/response regulator CckA